MLRLIAPIAFLLSLLPLSFAFAQDKPFYVSGFLGLNLQQGHDFTQSSPVRSGKIDFDSAPSFGGALGFKLSNNLRLEAEIGYTNQDISALESNIGNSSSVSGDVEAITFLLNGYYDFDLDLPVIPYIGAGAGLGYFDANVNDNGTGLVQNNSGDDLNFIYQVSGGLKYPINEDINLRGAYRYLGSADIGFDQTEIDYSSHEIRIGIDYALPILWNE